ncbi:MAG: septum formation initiator family protein [Bacteroidota bacterium]|jgi:cell division protein DivIC|nr:septum formation initiator family protein [Bacteroidota bacterium]
MKRFSFLYNRYIIVGGVFLIWMLFFDQSNVLNQVEQYQELKKAEANIVFLKQEIKRLEADYQTILNDPKLLEKIAREKYKMKYDDEDVYIVK